jgi:hypothetical protein
MTDRPDGHDPEIIELPAPTAWPMVVALGVTLSFAGLVTHAGVSAVGIVLALIGAVGWWRDVLPEPRVEHVALPPVERRAAPVIRVHPSAELPRPGVAGHRTRLPIEVQPYSAGIWGGLVGGVAMAVTAFAFGFVNHGSLWYVVNLIAGIAMPALARASLEDLRALHPYALVIATIVHGVLSVLAGLLYAVILPMLPSRHMLWGGVIAPLVWTGLVWAVAGVVNPAFATYVHWPWFIVTQMAFGVTTGFIVGRAHPLATMQTWPLAARAGVRAVPPRSGRERDR